MLHIAKRVCLNPWAKKLPENGKKTIFLEKKNSKKNFLQLFNYFRIKFFRAFKGSLNYSGHHGKASTVESLLSWKDTS